MKSNEVWLARLALTSLTALSATLAAALPAQAADSGANAPADSQAGAGREITRVVVGGMAGSDTLDHAAPTAGLLGLTARQTPATVNTVSAETMALRGPTRL